MVRLNARLAYGIAHSLDGRMGRARLREICDGLTEYDLTEWELDKLTQWVEEHPAYNALPEEDEELPTTPEA